MYDDEIKECMLSVRISELLLYLNCIKVVKRQVHFITTEIFGPVGKNLRRGGVVEERHTHNK